MSDPEHERQRERASAVLERLTETHQRMGELLEELAGLLASASAQNVTLRHLADYYIELWEAHYGHRSVWHRAKDTWQLKRLLRILSPEDLKARMAAFINDPVPYFVDAGHAFCLFASVVNRYGRALKQQEHAVARENWFSTCQHDPPCDSFSRHQTRVAIDQERARAAAERPPVVSH